MHQEIIKIIKPKEGSSIHFTKKMELAGRKVVYKGMCAISILIGLLMIIYTLEKHHVSCCGEPFLLAQITSGMLLYR